MSWKRSVGFFLAVCWLLLVLLAAFLAPTTLPSPNLLQTTTPPFQAEHWLGTDPVGYDVLTSLLSGARSAIFISLPAALCANLLGGLLGVLAGFFGNTRIRILRGWVVAALLSVVAAGSFVGHFWASPGLGVAALLLLGALLGRLLGHLRWGQKPVFFPLDDVVQALIGLLDSVPLLVLVLTVAAIQRPSPLGLVVLLTATCWTTPARVLRAATLRVVPLPFIAAAEAIGLPPLRIVRRHVWPMVWPVLLVRIPLSIALIIGLETTLSFLGIGMPPETPSWGRLLASSRLAPTAWWLVVCPGTTLFLTIWSLQRLAQENKVRSMTRDNVTK
ncbi:peptide/nickel transport system permease protein [Hymenobacter gelipurpurascens]|uniref:Peptide/nickel transport system permease protein n=1 Tax=Hymenobacter gelipurpurascens TaxID=89968 RepID=A0A212UB57_9BACT|nr:peptide/nickel transport system permease protein [Hymenobacter gelipurpurascens]